MGTSLAVSLLSLQWADRLLLAYVDVQSSSTHGYSKVMNLYEVWS